MMGKRLYITATVWSALWLLTVLSIPHHHHNGAWCAAVERCAEDYADNDSHTRHAGDRSCCLENERFLPVENEDHAHILLSAGWLGGMLADWASSADAGAGGRFVRTWAYGAEAAGLLPEEGTGGDRVRRGPPARDGVNRILC